ncbi:MAG: hypothetical protein CYPHOPRED_005318 [Cyphobasidiales sp. Tagirdzhanova-0007]|nr:MAG: hypothetical protein CYPHOPRED_005318 [Cyphobasidiales sp. Tagirdzhanova-0007]
MRTPSSALSYPCVLSLVLSLFGAATTAAPLDLLGQGTSLTPSSSGSASTRRSGCSKDGSYQTFTDSFHSLDSSEWVIESGSSGVKYGSDGATLTLAPSMSSSGGIVIASKDSWSPPLSLTVTLTASGAGGIVHPFILKPEGSGVDEDTFQTPVWKEGARLLKNGHNADIEQKLSSGTKEQNQFSYSYPHYNPAEAVTYKLDWTSDSITWSVGGHKRVAYKQNGSTGKFPMGPLPLRFGIWSTEANENWAGVLDWQKNPHPQMQVQHLTVHGCRS